MHAIPNVGEVLPNHVSTVPHGQVSIVLPDHVATVLPDHASNVLPDHMSNVLPDHMAHAPGVGGDEGPRPRLDDGVVGAREGAVQQQAE